MTRSETKLLLQLFNYANQTSKSMNSGVTVDEALEYLSAVKDAFQYDKEKYDQFSKVLRDFSAKRIYISRVKVKLMTLFKGHKYLILEFNSFMSKKHQNTLSLGNGELAELPWDVLGIICKTLDFDDLFSFSGVCKNWRTFHKSKFLSSQEPLLVRMNGCNTDSYSFISVPNKKVYDLKMMSCFKPPNCVYVGVSSGYFILAHRNNSFVLFNPFTRKKMEIDAAFTVNHKIFYQYEVMLYEVMLAFEKCSEKFVLVVLCRESSCLYVYQSRYYDWLIYSTLKPEEVVVDFVVSNNIIYLVTNNGNIGVLNLNSGNIKFLNLKNTPEKVRYRDPSQISFKLVNCDEQLLVIDFRLWYSRRGVYKIDLSTKNYVKQKTLGDIALFYVTGKNCRALSNPERFGYRSSYVYEVNCFSQCMYDWNDHRAKLYPHGGGDLSFFDWCFRHSICQGSARDFNFFDWCFRHLKYEVDYSLVE